jgi:formate dehydrogenase subunit delta
MSNVELNHLIKMLNQIVDNLAQGDAGDVVAARVADHLRRFWSPSMKKTIANYVVEDGSALHESARQAVVLIQANTA